MRDGTAHEGDLQFWAEWEPQARVVDRFLDAAPGWPQYVFEPVFDPPAAYVGHQNTDPFVFGERFLYSNCLQHKGGRPTGLQYLARGSVILFGSRLSGQFVLDTVFVVASSVPHEESTADTALRGLVPAEFFDIVLHPLYDSGGDCCSTGGGCCTHSSGRLYFGATPDEPVDGMFSYFPAVDAGESPEGFQRPRVVLDGLITQTMFRGWKGSQVASLVEMRELWERISEQVLGSSPGLRLGVRANMPARVSGVS